jgi:dTDP-glucose pyrophosphorylase
VDITLVLPCAGKATRLLGNTNCIPKGMIPVCGIPLLQYALDAGFRLPINRTVMVISPNGQAIPQYFGASHGGAPVHYVIQPEARGIADAVSMAEPFVKDWLLVVNGDEIFANCCHAEMEEFVEQNSADGLVGYLHTRDLRRIQIGYGMSLALDGRVEKLIEKPATTWNDILGVGTWLHRANFFDYFRKTPFNEIRNERDFVDVIQLMVDDGQRIYGFDLRGEFFNVNRREDLENAEAALRQRVAVVGMDG